MSATSWRTRLRAVGAVLLLLVLVVSLTASGLATPDGATEATVGETPMQQRIVVDADGGGDYRTIQAALENSSQGVTIEVRPGQYNKTFVEKSVTIVAPDGATVDFISVREGVSVTVKNIQITDFSLLSTKGEVRIEDSSIGSMGGLAGNWTITESDIGEFDFDGNGTGTIVDTSFDELSADDASGDWRLDNVTVEKFRAYRSSGNWVVDGGALEQADVEDSTSDWTIRGATLGELDANSAAGDWKIANTTVTGTSGSAISADRTSGDWTLRNVRASGGVGAWRASSDWTLRNVSIRPTDDRVDAVWADNATGNWTIEGLTAVGVGSGVSVRGPGARLTVRDTTVRDALAGVVGADEAAYHVENVTVRNVRNGIRAWEGQSDWQISGLTVTNASEHGIWIKDTSDWRITNTTVKNASASGLYARNAAGDWQVTNSVFINSGDGVDATRASGDWTITGSIITGNDIRGVRAIDASLPGDATGNWWGQPGGPTDRQCRGAVDCGNPLTERPEAGSGEPISLGSSTLSITQVRGTQFSIFAGRRGGGATVPVTVWNRGDKASAVTVEVTFQFPDEPTVRRNESSLQANERKTITVGTGPLGDLPAPNANASFSTRAVDDRTVAVTYEGGEGDLPTDRARLFNDELEFVTPLEPHTDSETLAPGEQVRVPVPETRGEFEVRTATKVPFVVTVGGENRTGTIEVFGPIVATNDTGGANLGEIAYGQTKAGAVDGDDSRTGPFVAPHENVTFAGGENDTTTLTVRRTGGDGDPTVGLVGPDGGGLGRNATGAAPRIENVTLPADGTYTVVVAGAETNGTFAYNLTLVGGPTGDLVVDDDGGADVDYTSISPAVDNASDGATVLVRPGTYTETVDVDGNLTVVAPDGATVGQPTGNPTAAFEVTGESPTVDGFRTDGFPTGVAATNTDGNWTVSDLIVAGDGRTAVDAFGSTGDWTVRNATLAREDRLDDTVGVNARTATGDWTVSDGEFASVARGVDAATTEGDWTVEGTTFQDASIAVDAGSATGDWLVADADVEGADTSVLAPETTGNWTVAETTVTDGGQLSAAGSSGDWTLRDLTLRGTGGVDASETGGAWTARNVTVRDADGAGLTARASTGAWTALNLTVTGADGAGIDATATEAGWTVRAGRVTDSGTGVAADESTAGWRVRDTRLRANGVGVSAARSSGDWTLRNVSIQDSGEVGLRADRATGDWGVGSVSDIAGAPLGVTARETTGAWEIHRTNLTNEGVDIDATGASPEGDARRNFWGIDGSADADCEGNVTCADVLVAPVGTPQTGLRVTLSGPDGETLEGARVFVYEDAGPVTVKTFDPATDEIPGGSTVNATTGTAGQVAVGGLDAAEHCLLVVPPGEDLDAAGRCVSLAADVVTSQQVTLDERTDEPPTESWPQFQADAANTGSKAVDGPRTVPVFRWQQSVEGEVLSSPIVANGSVYVATDRALHAFVAESGTERWSVDGEGTTGGPAFSDGTVYFRSGTGMHAINAATGGTEWTGTIPLEGHDWPHSSVTVADGVVVATISRGPAGSGMVAFDAESGDRKWVKVFEDRAVLNVRGTPAIGDDRVYGGSVAPETFPSTFPSVFALNLTTGEVVWTNVTQATIRAGPTVGDGRVYFHRSQGGDVQVFAFDTETGAPDESVGEDGLFRRAEDTGILSSPALGDGRLYVGDGDDLSAGFDTVTSGVAAIDVDEAALGEVEWNLGTGGAHFGSPAVSRETVYTATISTFDPETPSGIVRALDKSSGTVLWQYETADGIQASPAVAGGTLYAATNGDEGPADIHAVEGGFARPPDELAEPGTEAYIGHISPEPPTPSLRENPTASTVVDSALSVHTERVDGTAVLSQTATFTGEAEQSITAAISADDGEEKVSDDVRSAGRLTLVGPRGSVIQTSELDPNAGVIETTLPRDGVYSLVVSNDRVDADDSEPDVAYDLWLQSPTATTTTVESDGERVSFEVKNAKAGDRVTADVSDSVSSSVDSVSVTFADDSDSGSFDVSAGTETPNGLPAAPSEASAYLQVDHENVPDSKIGSGEVTLTLPKSEVDDPDNVTVYRYQDGWTGLPTTQTGETDNGYRFRVTTPGYSAFAVVTGQPPATSDDTQNESESETNKDGSVTEQPTAADNESPTTTAGADGPGFGFLVVLGALLGVGLLGSRDRE